MGNKIDSDLLLRQYECLSEIRQQLDRCLESIEQPDLTKHLEKLNHLMAPTNMNHLFSQKHQIISLFSTQPTLPHAIKQMIKEADEISVLQEQLLRIHHRAS